MIERAQPADFLAIAALDRIAWSHTSGTYIPDGEHAWRLWCEYATVLVARSGEPSSESEIVGALLMFPTEDGRNFLHKIMVHPDRRGEGLGTLLMRQGLQLSSRPVLLTVDPANEPAVQLYRNFGFEIAEHIEGYYRPHEHRYLMIRMPDREPGF